MVEADTPGFPVAKVIDLIAPHPIGALAFDGVKGASRQYAGIAGRRLVDFAFFHDGSVIVASRPAFTASK